ncbi:hypothetical protein D3C71_748430 [compost metagenome]
MSITDAIKQLSANQFEASNPLALRFGKVTKVNPLEVNVDQRFSLTEDFLIVPEQLTRYELDLKHKHGTSGESTKDALPDKIVIREGLKPGDNVLMLRMQGGSQYILLDKVV